ncbi:HNH endonuclease [Kocuria turfanensis]|uniref:HNH endonuclease n=1 Tax=Kocuria turfanensis TaxID=388357 RepID=UPI0040361176
MAGSGQFSFDEELRLRQEAMQWLAMRTHDGLHALHNDEIADFTFDGVSVRLKDRQRGIWKPRQLRAALSIMTAYTPPGKDRPYEDAEGADGHLRYKWRGDDPMHADNRALRRACESGLPLMWFIGIQPSIYQVLFPVYLMGEEDREKQFVVLIDDAQRVFEDAPILYDGPSLDQIQKRYAQRMAKQRLHQPVFRSMVMRAYDEHCAVCALHHVELLDAAHIVPDSHDAGVASVANGLSLCKIHHTAYDKMLMGIRPDYVVEIREDLLNEVDGPMLRHGLQERHGERLLVIPNRRNERPSRNLLEKSYEKFRDAA